MCTYRGHLRLQRGRNGGGADGSAAVEQSADAAARDGGLRTGLHGGWGAHCRAVVGRWVVGHDGRRRETAAAGDGRQRREEDAIINVRGMRSRGDALL